MDSLQHVAITVTDIRKAIEWYQQRFSFDLVYEDESWALLQFENVGLALTLAHQHPPHFAIERSDAGDFGPLKRHRDGTNSVYIEDPWHNIVEVMARN